ncbi:type III pantothenate kinase [Methylosarcina fibrata]|uniref:type III pantothenate kinase n=1 Tax=Methylosarcina fibrata TaxID=105972 RepID=UPI00035D3D57|nr:type III pantothenate kinase [Methylosarcina fibrata]
MNLLVDIGNTRLKWAMTEADRLVPGDFLANSQLSEERLKELWQSVPPPGRIAVSCVGAENTAELVCKAALELWPGAKITRIRSQADAFGVTNAYLQPEKLGADRWLSLIAVRHCYYSMPACIVDCGTAITVDLLDDHGRHQGGLICPGLRLMKQSLAASTAALKFDDARYDPGPANHTEAAIDSGVLTAAIGLIEHVFAAQPGNSLLILTGGDAERVAGHLAYRVVVDSDLVFRGLAIVLEEAV